MPVKDVVAEDQAYAVGPDELLPDEEGLGKALGARLNGICYPKAPPRPIPEEVLEKRQVDRCGDDKDVTDFGEHQNGKRVIDHRLIVDGKQLLAHHLGDRINASSSSAGEDNSLQRISLQ